MNSNQNELLKNTKITPQFEETHDRINNIIIIATKYSMTIEDYMEKNAIKTLTEMKNYMEKNAIKTLTEMKNRL